MLSARKHKRLVVTGSAAHRPRVLLLFSSSELGGAERSLSRMAFASHEVDYQLATLYGDGPWCDWVHSQGCEPLVLGRSANSGGGLMFGAFLRLIQHVRNHPVDVIYVCGSRAALLLRLIRIFLPRTKLVHGVRWNPDSDSRLDRFFRLMERFTHSLVDAWITNSAVAKQTLVSRCGIPAELIFVIHNGLESLPTDVPLIGERPLEVLTVANLSPRKGHREYLKVVREVVMAVPTAKFVLVGRDDMNGEVQRAIENAGLSGHIRYEGFQADVTPWYRRARVFVLPSMWGEGCPTAILEAMSFTVSCVAFSTDGIPELVENGRQGLLVQCGDYSGMAAAIIQLLTDAGKASTLGESGQERVHLHFRLENTAAMHSVAFSKILSTGGGMKAAMEKINIDDATVAGFGDEWSRFDQNGLSHEVRERIFDDYFSIFPWEALPKDAVGADVGCGSGRWAAVVAPRVGRLLLVDASGDALAVARKNLANAPNVRFEKASVGSLPLEDASLDFAYSLGVLHHVPYTAAAIRSISEKLKSGAPFLVFLYYSFENRGVVYRGIWKASDMVRRLVSRMPFCLRYWASQALAMTVYWPLARTALLLDRLGLCPVGWPLAYYKDKPFYVLRTDALDRFGTRLEQRFSRAEIQSMLEDAGFKDIRFSDKPPYWCALGMKG